MQTGLAARRKLWRTNGFIRKETMKILFLTDCYPSEQLPQYCVFLEQQAQALIALGHSVDVLYFTQEEKTFIYHGVPVMQRPLTTTGSKWDAVYPKQLNRTDTRTIAGVLLKGYDAVSFHFGNLRLLKTVRKQCKRLGIPLVMHFHGLGIWRYYDQPHPMMNAVGNLSKTAIYRKLDATVNVSDKVRQVFTRKIKTVPSYVVYNGVNCELFSPQSHRKLFEDGSIRILCVANLIAIKGQKYLIEAAKLLTDKGYRVQLTFAGRGPDEQSLRELAETRSVAANFLGYLPYEQVAKLMAEHDLFIMPSYFEALGCVYLEAMASGMLTVGVKGQGIDEVIKDGENGFNAEVKSAESIAEIAETLFSMPEADRAALVERAVQTANAFSWEASAKSLEAVYQEVTGERT